MSPDIPPPKDNYDSHILIFFQNCYSQFVFRNRIILIYCSTPWFFPLNNILWTPFLVSPYWFISLFFEGSKYPCIWLNHSLFLQFPSDGPFGSFKFLLQQKQWTFLYIHICTTYTSMFWKKPCRVKEHAHLKFWQILPINPKFYRVSNIESEFLFFHILANIKLYQIKLIWIITCY